MAAIRASTTPTSVDPHKWSHLTGAALVPSRWRKPYKLVQSSWRATKIATFSGTGRRGPAYLRTRGVPSSGARPSPAMNIMDWGRHASSTRRHGAAAVVPASAPEACVVGQLRRGVDQACRLVRVVKPLPDRSSVVWRPARAMRRLSPGPFPSGPSLVVQAMSVACRASPLLRDLPLNG